MDVLIHQIFNGLKLDPAGMDPMIAVMFFLGLPTYVLQAAALYGLLRREVWGREAATLAAVVLMFTIVGLPFGYWALKRIWPTSSVSVSSATAPV